MFFLPVVVFYIYFLCFIFLKCCAAKFIEMIDAKSLSLSEDEFNR